jgi:hypothetical protein
MKSPVYQIVLTGGDELLITLDSYKLLDSGALRITDADHKTIHFGPTAWFSIGVIDA